MSRTKNDHSVSKIGKIWEEIIEEEYVHIFFEKAFHSAPHPDKKKGDLKKEYHFIREAFLSSKKFPKIYVCPKCFSTINYERSQTIYCEECKETFNNDEIKNFASCSFECTYFGYLYRDHYEKGLEIKPLIPPPSSELIYLGSLVLAGIIGGLAYDAFKKLLKIIIKKGKSNKVIGKEGDRISFEEWLKLVGVKDEVELKKFYKLMSDYWDFVNSSEWGYVYGKEWSIWFVRKTPEDTLKVISNLKGIPMEDLKKMSFEEVIQKTLLEEIAGRVYDIKELKKWINNFFNKSKGRV